jgi:hypothetical protein
MLDTLVQQADFVIEALSTSTNQDNVKERADVLMRLRVARDAYVDVIAKGEVGVQSATRGSSAE